MGRGGFELNINMYTGDRGCGRFKDGLVQHIVRGESGDKGFKKSMIILVARRLYFR